jgi:hypothetical protein
MMKVRTPLTTVRLAKRLVVGLAAGAVAVGVFTAPASAAPAGGPGEPTCEAEVISTSVPGTGRRAVVEGFLGEYPRAVRDAEKGLQEFCAG